MLYLLLLLVPSLVVVIGFKMFLHSTISWKEMAVQALVPLVLIIVVWNVSRYSLFADTQVINGKVTGKEKDWTTCEHSYECRCKTVRSGSGKNRTSRRVCDTCYRHANDWNWRVYTTAGNFNVARIDSRGSYEPPRWTLVEKDQPYARTEYYRNPVRAAPDSLFHFAKAAAYKGPLPPYPDPYDYQYIDRVIGVGVDIPEIKQWNDLLARSLNDMGAAKQVNYTIVMTNQSPLFASALRAEWLGGKKNDVTVVIGTSYPQIKWVRIFSWAKHDIINVGLRNDLLASQTLDPARTVGLISRDINQYYERRPMEDFEYLAEEAVPPTWVMIFALLIGGGVAVWLGIYFHKNECFEGNNRDRHIRRRY